MEGENAGRKKKKKRVIKHEIRKETTKDKIKTETQSATTSHDATNKTRINTKGNPRKRNQTVFGSQKAKKGAKIDKHRRARLDKAVTGREFGGPRRLK